MFEIIKGLPLAKNLIGKDRVAWPWKNMAVGDAVLINRDQFEKAKNSVNAHCHRTGRKFRRQKVDDSSWLFQRIA